MLSRVVLVCPTPCYIRVKCCNNSEHIENFESPDYGDDLIDHQEQHRWLLGGGGWGSAIGLNFDILDTTAVVSPVDPSLCCRLTRSGTSIRCERDGVHLSREVYMDVASAIVDWLRWGGRGRLREQCLGLLKEEASGLSGYTAVEQAGPRVRIQTTGGQVAERRGRASQLQVRRQGKGSWWLRAWLWRRRMPRRLLATQSRRMAVDGMPGAGPPLVAGGTKLPRFFVIVGVFMFFLQIPGIYNLGGVGPH